MNIQRKAVENALAKTRTLLKKDGGDVELVDITTDGIVKVRLKGACNGCPMATMTLKSVIERALRNEVPEVKQVQQVL
ncbi:MAG TPA: NifU family protein [Deltaproteobacteria bacterium]|nr:NifU family protein [Deltaproteobacteria bacterium]